MTQDIWSLSEDLHQGQGALSTNLCSPAETERGLWGIMTLFQLVWWYWIFYYMFNINNSWVKSSEWRLLRAFIHEGISKIDLMNIELDRKQPISKHPIAWLWEHFSWGHMIRPIFYLKERERYECCPRCSQSTIRWNSAAVGSSSSTNKGIWSQHVFF